MSMEKYRVLYQLPEAYACTTLDVAIILGSGLTSVADSFNISAELAYTDIENFPRCTAPTHKSKLSFATTAGLNIGIFNGRLHLYEGLAARDIVAPVYLSHALGARYIIVLNAVGALNPEYQVSDIVLIEDHLNFTGSSPLTGVVDESIGPRFPDMSQPYCAELRKVFARSAHDASINTRYGIYAGVAGPQLETSAERRYLRMAGADVVGMSLVHEVIAAAHCGARVLALSVVTNSATGAADQQADSIEQVIDNANKTAKKIARVLPAFLEQLSASA